MADADSRKFANQNKIAERRLRGRVAALYRWKITPKLLRSLMEKHGTWESAVTNALQLNAASRQQAGAAVVNTLRRIMLEHGPTVPGGTAFAANTPEFLAYLERPIAPTLQNRAKNRMINAVNDALQEKKDPARAAVRALPGRAAITAHTRTLTISALNASNEMAWRAADAAGHIDLSRMVRVWIVADDERLCPICAPMAGDTAEVGRPFPSGFEYPPAHINCRCSTGLIRKQSATRYRERQQRLVEREQARRDRGGLGSRKERLVGGYDIDGKPNAKS